MELTVLCQQAHGCKGIIGKLSTEEKNAVLNTAADLLINKEEIILSANVLDIKYKRNLIRKEILPMLEKVNPSYSSSIENLIKNAIL